MNNDNSANMAPIATNPLINASVFMYPNVSTDDANITIAPDNANNPRPVLTPMLPNLAAELAGYGIASGLLCSAKMPVIVKLLIAQVFGHILKALVILFSVNVLGSTAVPTALICTSITAGLPGILLQWSLIPLIVFWAGNRKNGHD